MRKLGIPSVRDKVVQEVMHMISKPSMTAPTVHISGKPAMDADQTAVAIQRYENTERSGRQ